MNGLDFGIALIGFCFGSVDSNETKGHTDKKELFIISSSGSILVIKFSPYIISYIIIF